MKRNTKVLSGAILLAGALLVLAAPAAAQVRRPSTRENDLDTRATLSRKAAAVESLRRAPSAVSELFVCETSTTECRATSATFTVGKLRDLFIFVTWPNTSGDRVQTVEFFLPEGSLYLKRDTRFSARAGQPRARRVAGSAAVADEYLTTSRGAPTVVTPLAVAGTYITQRNLLGTWTVRVSLDGKHVLTGQFTLKSPDPK